MTIRIKFLQKKAPTEDEMEIAIRFHYDLISRCRESEKAQLVYLDVCTDDPEALRCADVLLPEEIRFESARIGFNKLIRNKALERFKRSFGMISREKFERILYEVE